jgi:hypothetical protein
MHLHQPLGWIIAKDGKELLQPIPGDTINVAPGERYTVLYQMTDPGVWAWHCHILTHAERPTACSAWSRPSSSTKRDQPGVISRRRSDGRTFPRTERSNPTGARVVPPTRAPSRVGARTADAVDDRGGRDRCGDALRDALVEHRRHDELLVQLGVGDRLGDRLAAASFMFSVMLVARASSAPRKMPGNASTLLIWFG